MRRLGALAGGVIGALGFVVVRRARASRGKVTPAPVSAPVRMAVGESSPEVLIPDEGDPAAP